MFPLFTTAWALAILFHLSTPQGGTRNPVSIFLFVTAIAAIFFPTYSLLLLALCILQMAQFWIRLPFAQTSEYFKFICSICLVSTYVDLALAESTLHIEPEAWFRSFGPLLRLATSLLFFAAVLHKLNRDFFKAEASDAPEFFNRLLAALGISIPARVQAIFPYITILIEAFIAVGLLFPATRLAALGVLMLFFFLIGAQGIVQFSSLMYAMALLFFDEEVLSSAAAQLGLSAAHPVAFGIGCCLFFPLAIAFRQIRVAGVSILSLFMVFALARAAMTWSSPVIWSAPTFPLSLAQIALLILFWLNELGPYVGYKDWPVFSMYSNLRTGRDGNHLFLGAWLFLPFFKRRDEVRITSATMKLLYDDPARDDIGYYLPFSSLAAAVRLKGSRLVEESRRQIEYMRQDTHIVEDIESLGKKGKTWLDFVMPPRFFFHLPSRRERLTGG